MHPGRRFSHWKFIARAKVRRTLFSGAVSPHRESSHQRFRVLLSSRRRPSSILSRFSPSLFLSLFFLSFFFCSANRESPPPCPQVMRFYESQSGLGSRDFLRSATYRDSRNRTTSGTFVSLCCFVEIATIFCFATLWHWDEYFCDERHIVENAD